MKKPFGLKKPAVALLLTLTATGCIFGVGDIADPCIDAGDCQPDDTDTDTDDTDDTDTDDTDTDP